MRRESALAGACLGAVAVALVAGFGLGRWWAQRDVLAGVVPVTVSAVAANPAVAFVARLDSGAEMSSINATDIDVIGAAGRPSREHAGLEAEFTVVNGRGGSARLRATVENVRTIRMSDCIEPRYHVYLAVTLNGRTSRVLMNLNDRAASRDKLLLGRNWLDQGFLVDVSRQ